MKSLRKILANNVIDVNRQQSRRFWLTREGASGREGVDGALRRSHHHGRFGLRKRMSRLAATIAATVWPAFVAVQGQVPPSSGIALPAFTFDVRFDERTLFKVFRDEGQMWLRTIGMEGRWPVPGVAWIHQQALTAEQMQELSQILRTIEALDWVTIRGQRRAYQRLADLHEVTDGWELKLPEGTFSLFDQSRPEEVRPFKTFERALYRIAALDAAATKARRETHWRDGRGGGAVGIAIEATDGRVEVLHVFAGFGAARAGIQEGDELVRVGGQDVEGRSVADLTAMLKGEPGSVLEMIVRRPGTRSTLSFQVERTPLAEVLDGLEQERKTTEPAHPAKPSQSSGR